MQIGDIVTMAIAENGNNVQRENVRAEIIGFRGPIVVGNTVEGKFTGEGVWCFDEDVITHGEKN